MTFVGWCERCGGKVDADYAAYPITGWEYARREGGANQIHHRERIPDRVAHPHCADLIEHGKQGEQTSLLP